LDSRLLELVSRLSQAFKVIVDYGRIAAGVTAGRYDYVNKDMNYGTMTRLMLRRLTRTAS
jgi:hypothetical protein